MLMSPFVKEVIQVVLDERVPVVTTGQEILVNIYLHLKKLVLK